MKKKNQALSILFWLNRQRSKNQMPAIYLRFSLDYKRVELATHLHVDPRLWNSEGQCVSGISEEAGEINSKLSIIKDKLHKHYNRLLALDETITAETLKNAYLGIGERQRTLLELLDFYHSRFAEKVATGRKAKNTLKCVHTTNEKIKAFLKYNFHVSDIYLREIKHSFAPNLEHFLVTRQGLSNNSAMKYIRTFKRMIKQAVDQDWMSSNPLSGFKCTYDQPQRDCLTMEEIMILYKKDLHLARLSEVRDVFIFSCFTGYAYRDVLTLTADNVVIGIDGGKWIVKDREKTNSPERIPLLPIASEILERYKNHPYCLYYGCLLPVNSNQCYNGYLKEIADLCGIKKNLTTHVARHTFATTVTLENDVPMETVSQMLGHESIKTTQIYAKVTQREVSYNMRALRKRLFGEGIDLKQNTQ
jgi:site-specific recombinase XerD